MKKIVFMMLALITFFGIGVTCVSAEEYTGEFRKISTDGTLTVKSFVPKDCDEALFLLTAISGDLIDESTYWAFATCTENEDVSEMNFGVGSIEGEYFEEHNLEINYITPDAKTTEKINEIASKMKKYDTLEEIGPEDGYRLEDLYLINYLYANPQGFNAINGNARALNFTKDLIEGINGSNVSFKFDVGAGFDIPTGLFNAKIGEAIIYYKGVAYTTIRTAILENHVIYIPDTTEATHEAYEAAVLARIGKYLGTTEGITVEYGNTLESLNYMETEYGQTESGNWGPIGEHLATYNDYDLIDEEASDGNYYNITIKGVTYRFAVLTAPETELETPKYIGSDIESNIKISTDATLPLDTALTVTSVENEKIEEAIGNSVYAAYDISLYSNFEKAYVTNLENGKFLVSIPVPAILEGKEITAYYITSTGEKEEHVVTVKNNVASFETDHFSTYILAELPVKIQPEIIQIQNPTTGDDVVLYGIIAGLSIVVVISTIIYFKKKKID